MSEPHDGALAGVRRRLHDQLLQRVDADALDHASRAERRLRVRGGAYRGLRGRADILPQAALTRVVNDVSDQVVGLGPVEPLLRDPDVTEVMVNGPGDVYVERRGGLGKGAPGLFEGGGGGLAGSER